MHHWLRENGRPWMAYYSPGTNIGPPIVIVKSFPFVLIIMTKNRPQTIELGLMTSLLHHHLSIWFPDGIDKYIMILMDSTCAQYRCPLLIYKCN